MDIDQIDGDTPTKKSIDASSKDLNNESPSFHN